MRNTARIAVMCVITLEFLARLSRLERRGSGEQSEHAKMGISVKMSVVFSLSRGSVPKCRRVSSFIGISKRMFLLFAAISERSTRDFESNADSTEPKNATKNSKAKKPKPKKRARPKLTIETCEGHDDGKVDDELPPDSADTTCETPRAPSPTKGKKTKGSKKKRKSSTTTPPKAKFEFPEVTSHDDSFSENSSVSPNDIAKEVVAARKQLEAQKNNREVTSDVDDDVFKPSHDGRDGLSLLAQASFASVDTHTKRKRSEAVSPSEDLSQKKRGRPKKASESPPFEPGKLQ